MVTDELIYDPDVGSPVIAWRLMLVGEILEAIDVERETLRLGENITVSQSIRADYIILNEYDPTQYVGTLQIGQCNFHRPNKQEGQHKPHIMAECTFPHCN